MTVCEHISVIWHIPEMRAHKSDWLPIYEQDRRPGQIDEDKRDCQMKVQWCSHPPRLFSPSCSSYRNYITVQSAFCTCYTKHSNIFQKRISVWTDRIAESFPIHLLRAYRLSRGQKRDRPDLRSPETVPLSSMNLYRKPFEFARCFTGICPLAPILPQVFTLTGIT